MTEKTKGRPRAEFDPEHVRNVSVEVYKMRLADTAGSGPGAVERMLAKDGDKGEKLRARAASYDSLTRSYLRALALIS